MKWLSLLGHSFPPPDPHLPLPICRFFAGNSNCTGGWANYPTFGLGALNYTWNFNFELT